MPMMAPKAFDPIPDRPFQSRHTDRATAFTSTEQEHRLQWEALVDAGLIGAPQPPTPPDVTATRDANDALFRRLRSERSR
jgi:hypothetical protein